MGIDSHGPWLHGCSSNNSSGDTVEHTPPIHSRVLDIFPPPHVLLHVDHTENSPNTEFCHKFKANKLKTIRLFELVCFHVRFSRINTCTFVFDIFSQKLSGIRKKL